MDKTRLPRVTRLAVASALAGLMALVLSAAALASGGASAAPRFVEQALAGATLSGQAQLRFLGLRIYDARLWVGPAFDAADFAAHPLALELTYRRAFAGSAIAQRSVEEMARQGEITPAQIQRWQQSLAAVLPDVQPGDRLTGVYQPGRGLSLWRGDQALGSIEEAELARRFMGIWLSPQTSEPGLRSALLARPPGVAP